MIPAPSISFFLRVKEWCQYRDTESMGSAHGLRDSREFHKKIEEQTKSFSTRTCGPVWQHWCHHGMTILNSNVLRSPKLARDITVNPNRHRGFPKKKMNRIWIHDLVSQNTHPSVLAHEMMVIEPGEKPTHMMIPQPHHVSIKRWSVPYVSMGDMVLFKLRCSDSIIGSKSSTLLLSTI